MPKHRSARRSRDVRRRRLPTGFVVVLLAVPALVVIAVVVVTKTERSDPATPNRGLAGLPSSPRDTPTAGASAPPTRDEVVTLAVAGDVHFAGRNERLLEHPASAFGPIAKTLAAADLAMVNLETAITDGGDPQPKSFHFRAPASAFSALRAAGIDVASMANNHGVDYGLAGLSDTLRAIERTGFPVVGIGANAEAAYAPYVVDIGDTTVALLAASQLPDYTYYNWTATESSGGIASTKNIELLLDNVARAGGIADVVVVYLHWGDAANPCPTARMRELAGSLSDAGADVVVGTHAHLLLGAGYLGDTFVAYGLGNFLWWRNDAFSDDTGVLTLKIRDRRVVSAAFTPAVIDGNGRPQPILGQAATAKIQAFDALRECTDLTASAGG